MTTFWLLVMHGTTLVSRLRLVNQRVTVGRSHDCDVILRSDGVSRHHAEFVAETDAWLVRDLASRNGVRVNGVRIEAARRIEAGDTIGIEEYELALHRELSPGDVSARLAQTVLEMAPPRPAPGHLSSLLTFNGALLATEERALRWSLLCGFMVGDDVHAASATILALPRSAPPGLCGEPTVLAGDGAPRVSRSVLRAVCESGSVVIASNHPQGLPGALATTEPDRPQTTVLAYPLGETAKELEVLYLTLPSSHGTSDWRMLVTMAAALYQQAEDVWTTRTVMRAQARLQHELEHAHDLQMRLVPRDFKVRGFDIGFGFEPCKGVGGDYIDALPMPDGRILLVAMDVAGKGWDAALIASGLHTTVHICARQWFSLTDIITMLNDYLIKTWDAATSVTVAASILDPRTGTISSINCGHPCPLIVGQTGQVRELVAFETIPLGLVEFDVATRIDRLRAGELLAYCSDGLSEMFDERDVILGADGVASTLSQVRGDAGPHAPASDLVARLHDRLRAFRGRAPPSDDISVILVVSNP